ncbi:phage terminase large subunit family protein, partial [Escherichia coli]|uniref:phage terminase large subunit family protein n=1 Tax=Escherichia coli TaxID=562 RepID=UPI001E5D6B9E
RNNLQRKEMSGAILDFRGASAPGNFRRLTKQVVEGDEVDGWPYELAPLIGMTHSGPSFSERL